MDINTSTADTILDAACARAIGGTQVIQTLWSGYGEIVRVGLHGSDHASVILKHIQLPNAGNHPRGWNTDLSHQRKIRSYQVETLWYEQYAQRCNSHCPVPDCLAVDTTDNETLLVLTDLDAAGFDIRKDQVDVEDIYACLDWLANFHAVFLHSAAKGLWDCGTYWHLDTRPDELVALEDAALRRAAPLIDEHLKKCRYQTLVHGDAKLANFCFTNETPIPRVAAVDFQYVGRGCGMKDVAYFIGSCLQEDQCEALESALLDRYFSILSKRVEQQHPGTDAADLEQEWRAMYSLAWADFHRFIKGWSPGHWKINSYSERLSREVIASLQLADPGIKKPALK